MRTRASGMWSVEIGKGSKGSYNLRYTFPADQPSRARLHYASINIGNGYKKRLVSPRGSVVRREFS